MVKGVVFMAIDRCKMRGFGSRRDRRYIDDRTIDCYGELALRLIEGARLELKLHKVSLELLGGTSSSDGCYDTRIDGSMLHMEAEKKREEICEYETRIQEAEQLCGASAPSSLMDVCMISRILGIGLAPLIPGMVRSI